MSDHEEIHLAFNKHFVAAGHLSENGGLDHLPTDDNVFAVHCRHTFTLDTVCSSVVKNALLTIDHRKCTGEDNLDPYFLRLPFHIITEQITFQSFNFLR